MNEPHQKKGKTGTKSKMKRSLGTASVFAICTGAMFSSGFFLLPGLTADESGPSLPLVYLFASLLILPAIFSMAELSAAIPRAGGPYLFLNRSMGSLIGLIGAFGKYLQLLLKGAFAFVGVGAYLSLVLKLSIEPVAIGLIVLFTALNLLGVKQTARTEIILVSILLLLLTYFVTAGIVEIQAKSINLRDRFQPLLPFGIEGLWSGVALIFVSYGGIGQIASLAEEIHKPARSIPRGMLLALGGATFFYITGTFVMVALLSPEALQDDPAPVATTAVKFLRLPLPEMVVVVAALAAFASTGNAAIMSAARYPLALARDGLLWRKLGNLDARGVPKTAVMLTGITLIGLVLTLDLKGIAKLASAFLLFVFLGMCMAVIIFRESKSKEYQPGYHSPLYPWTQLIGIMVYLALIIESGLAAIGLIVGVCILGTLWYFYGVREHRNQSPALLQLFHRLAQKSPKTSISNETGLPLLAGTHLVHLTERAIVLDLKEESSSLENVIQQSADRLKSHVGGNRDDIAKNLKEALGHWRSPSRSEVAISPALLHGIEQAEILIIRGKINAREVTYKGLIVLVDDEESSDRLLKLLSQLETVILHTDFPKIWQEAKSAKDLKNALKHNIQSIQTMNIRVEDSSPAASLAGTCLKDADLPDGSLVTLLEREGELRVPNGKTKIHRGDRITIVGNADAIKSLRKRFNNENN
jgi:APA family basic amino acid/polyamine antiporter